MLLKKVLSLDCKSLSPTLTNSKSFTLPGGKIVNGFGCDFGNDETDIFMVPAVNRLSCNAKSKRNP